jgi:hypothetical protein
MSEEQHEDVCMFCQMAGDVWDALLDADTGDDAYAVVRAAVQEAFWLGVKFAQRNPGAALMAMGKRVD